MVSVNILIALTLVCLSTTEAVVPLNWNDYGEVSSVQGFSLTGIPSVSSVQFGAVELAVLSAPLGNTARQSTGSGTDGSTFTGFSSTPQDMDKPISTVQYFNNLYAFSSRPYSNADSGYSIQFSKWVDRTDNFKNWYTIYTDSSYPIQNLACSNFTNEANVGHLVCTWQQSATNDQFIGYTVGDHIGQQNLVVYNLASANRQPVGATAHTVALFDGPLFVGSERMNGLFMIYRRADALSDVRYMTTSDPTTASSWSQGPIDIQVNSLTGLTAAALPVTECENTILIAYANRTDSSDVGNLAYFLFDTSMEFVSPPFPVLSQGEVVPARNAPGFNFFKQQLWIYSVNITSSPLGMINVFATPVNEMATELKSTCKKYVNSKKRVSRKYVKSSA